MRNEILKLIDKPLSEDKKLSQERLKYIDMELSNLTDEYLIAFKAMLETNSIDNYKDFFSEKDYKEMKDTFKGKVIKENFNYMSFIIDSFYNFE